MRRNKTGWFICCHAAAAAAAAAAALRNEGDLHYNVDTEVVCPQPNL